MALNGKINFISLLWLKMIVLIEGKGLINCSCYGMNFDVMAFFVFITRQIFMIKTSVSMVIEKIW